MLKKYSYYIIPILTFLIIWIPVIAHYRVPGIVVTEEMLNKEQISPADTILNELNEIRLSHLGLKDDKETVFVAEGLLRGELRLPNSDVRKIGVPFDVSDIDSGLPGWQVLFSGFIIPEILLNAYKVTGRNEFLMTARDDILEWASYERSAWLPKGMLWNDLSIVLRIGVLSEFWRLYRHHPEYKNEDARAVLQLVARGGQFLSKPSHFTFNTSHGLLQNLGLLHLCVAFPALPGIENHKEMALSRLRDQLNYLISDEGIILQHSARYHKFVLEHLGRGMRYLSLLNLPIPKEWVVKYQKAIVFYGQLRRPDGSLPVYGDTEGDGNSEGTLLIAVMNENGTAKGLEYQNDWMPLHPNSMYPVEGYSIWWDGLDNWPDEKELSQTTVIWSFFPGHSHKHADEMSVLLYAGGQSWWTNAGYWPYGVKGRSYALSWDGSNAPHMVGEDTNSMRKTILKSYGWSDNLAVVDLEREGSKGYFARRQVIHIKPGVWIVIDSFSGDANIRTSTTWTVDPSAGLTRGEIPGSFILTGDKSNSLLKAFFITSGEDKISVYNGSERPFAGWVMNKPADAIVIEQPVNNSWTAVIWSLENNSNSDMSLTKQPYVQNWDSIEQWDIALPVQKGILKISRSENLISVSEAIFNQRYDELKLAVPDEYMNEYKSIRNAYEYAENKYTTFNPYTYRRIKVTILLVIILILQEMFFFTYRKYFGENYFTLRIMNVVGWISITTWLVTYFFKT